MEGPNVRWKTEDGELPRIRRRAPGESPLGCRSGCSAEDLVAPPRICLLRPMNRPSAARSAARRRAPPARRSVRPARPGADAFAARIARSATRTPDSAVRAPAPTPGCSRRGRRRLRRNPSAGFRNRNVGSGADLSARRSIRWLRSPIRRLESRLARTRLSQPRPARLLSPDALAMVGLVETLLPSRLIPHRHRPRAELQPAHELQVDMLR